MRPNEFDLHVSASPTASIYDKGRRLHNFMDRITQYRQEAETCAELLSMVNKGLSTLDLGAPLRAVYVDGQDGTETDFPEFMHIAVLMIYPIDSTGDIYPTVH